MKELLRGLPDHAAALLTQGARHEASRYDDLWADRAAMSWGRAASPGGRYSLYVRDADDWGKAGPEARGPGYWALVDGDHIVTDGRLAHPSNARVADDGTFLIADSPGADALWGRLCAFDATGALVLDEPVAATISDTFLAADGAYAAVACVANSSAPAFSQRLTVYDLRARSQLWDAPLVDGRPSVISFDPGAGVVRVTGERLGPITYRLSDGAVDDATMEMAILREGDGWTILRVVERALAGDAPLDPRRAADLVEACDRAEAYFATRPTHRAKAQRLAGEALLRAGDEAGALTRWRAALAVDPKVGIRRRADALAEKLAH